MRISHPKFGLGVVLSEHRSESGMSVAVVVFDNSPEVERLIVPSFLEPSTERMPRSAKKSAKRKSAPKAKPEPVPDELIVETSDPYLPPMME